MRSAAAVALFVVTCVCAALHALDGTASAQPPAALQAQGDDAATAQELNRQLNNPVSSVWSLNFQHNFQLFDGSLSDRTRWQYNLNFQPVIPLRLTEDWNLITRPIFPVLAGVDVFEPRTGAFDDHSGFGDVVLTSLLSPAKTDGFLWGVGPSFIFPTASSDALGAGKWQLGPSALALFLGREWIVGGLVNQWWSYAGDGKRQATSSMNLQYFVFRLLPGNWQVGLAPNILVNWKADGGNMLTFPIGLGVGKLFKFGKLPIKLTLEVDYSIARPDSYGQRWNVRLQMIPVLPALYKDVVFR